MFFTDKLSVICIVAIIAIIIALGLHYKNERHSLYSTSDSEGETLYGQVTEQNKLLDKIFGKDGVIEVVGLAGAGKTMFIRNTTQKLVKEHGYCVVYVEVFKHIDISSVINHLVSDRHCMSTFRSVFLSLNGKYYKEDNTLQLWHGSLQPNTVLILDDEDALMGEIDQKIIEPLSTMLLKTTIIRVSHSKKIEYLRRPVIQFKGMNPVSCGKWISSRYEQISFQKGIQLCHELDGVPLEVEALSVYATHPLTSGSIDDIINEIKSSEYGKAYEYLESILGIKYKDTVPHNKRMYLLYDRLSPEHRICIWLLIEMKESDAFSKDTAKQHLQNINIDIDDCLDSLLAHSFLETDLTTPQKLFRFRPYVRKFIQSIGEPSYHDTSTKARSFYGNYVYNNAKHLHFQLERTHDLQVAIDIGFNRRLVNTFLQILGGRYELKPLFKIALKVIEEHYCTINNVGSVSNAKTLLAFTYLTKALHCPWFHAPAILLPSRPKLVPKENLCFSRLYNCPAVLSIDKKDYESIEALGYHNSLLVYSLDSAPWQFNFTDVALMVTLADNECIQYCKRTSYCQCGKKMSIEYGLKQFLVGNYVLSIKYFQTTLYQFSTNTQPCQSILKAIAIVGIYASKPDHTTRIAMHHHLNGINFDDLDLSCFLGVLHDLIVPFLLKVNSYRSQNLWTKLNKTLEEEEKRCNMEAKTDEQRLDCGPNIRYAFTYGMTALKMRELQDELKWPQEVTEYSSREEWVCSVIRDKTTKCKEALPLFSQVRSIETEKNYEYLWVMKYFMDEAEFEQLDKNARSIPRFFQLMSI